MEATGDSPSNWSTGALPGPSDDVVINQTGITVRHASSASDSVNSLTIYPGVQQDTLATLAISNGTLSLNRTSSILGQLMMTAWTLSTAGSLNISGGAMLLQGGTMTGGGAITIGSGALSIFQVSLYNATLHNVGNAFFGSNGAHPVVLYDSTIVNEAGASITFATNSLIESQGTSASFENQGTLIQPASAATTPLSPRSRSAPMVDGSPRPATIERSSFGIRRQAMRSSRSAITRRACSAWRFLPMGGTSCRAASIKT